MTLNGAAVGTALPRVVTDLTATGEATGGNTWELVPVSD